MHVPEEDARQMPLFAQMRSLATPSSSSGGAWQSFAPSPEEILQCDAMSGAAAAAFQSWMKRSMQLSPPVEHKMLAIGGNSHVLPTDPEPFPPPVGLKRLVKVFAETVPFSDACERLCREQLEAQRGALADQPDMKWVHRTMLPMTKNFDSDAHSPVSKGSSDARSNLMSLRDPMPFSAVSSSDHATTLTAIHLSTLPLDVSKPPRLYEYPSTFSHAGFRDQPTTFHREDKVFSTIQAHSQPSAAERSATNQPLPSWATEWSKVPIGGHSAARDSKTQQSIRDVLFDGLELVDDKESLKTNPFERNRPAAGLEGNPMRWVSFSDS